ncbi:hypothetical protein BAE44_0013081 [Dichanthelium oligosanthes]|uniref:Uncharacterized protein n=1 Tax=Dichanthelium oligosanthes TaxID=888268 RepID=A0A1E5VL83_9POAL|nr:hypothetical protein BAE44_0013081 [Dichanthelium oligosanthes]
MAKGGLSKLKCMIKRAGFALEESWRRCVAPSSVVAIGGGEGRGSASFHSADGVPPGLHLVYMGKSRRRYLIAPLKRRQRGELGSRSSGVPPP